MEWVKKNLLGKGTEDNATGSASSKPTLAACGVVLGSRTARDTELPPEGFPDHAAASMDGTAYLTQPGAVFDDGESSHDDGGGEVSDGNGDIRTEGRPKQPGFHTPKGQRLGAGGDVPSKFEASPVGRQHSSTTELLKLQATPVAEEKSPPPSLSQSVVELPLRSPSPLALFQMTQHSPPPKSSDKGDATEVDGAGPDSNKSEASPMPSDVDRKEVRFTPVKDPLESCKSASKENEMQQQHSQAVIAPAIDVDNSVEESQRKHLFQQMKMKKQAIHRALLHLSDSSYSFVYDEGTENGQLNGSSNGHEDDPGLPFIGPSLKEQYNTLRLLLHKGLLGHTKDDMKGEAKPKIAGRSRRRRDLGGDANLSAASHDETKLESSFLVYSNVSAVLMGPRGHGKTLVLERCLASLSRAARRKVSQQRPDRPEERSSPVAFRVVRLNGLLFQGDNAVACVREIARQIGAMSQGEQRRRRKRKRRSRWPLSDDPKTPTPPLHTSALASVDKCGGAVSAAPSSFDLELAPTPGALTPGTPNPNTPASMHSRDSQDLSNRHTGFNTHIALLDEVLLAARIDRIPILVVLEELDTFLTARSAAATASKAPVAEGGRESAAQDSSSRKRELLLYHLLDRVADHKYLISLVGMTTDLTTMSNLEKRVQSRAEGTSKAIYFGHNKGYDDIIHSLLGKFYTPPGVAGQTTNRSYSEQHAMLGIRDEVEAVLRGGQLANQENKENNRETNDFNLVQHVLKRNYKLLGSDMRWVCRVLDVALGLLASDIDECMHQCMENDTTHDKQKGSHDIPKLSPKHVAQALVTMSASLDDISGTLGRPGIPTQSALEIVRWGQLLEDPDHYSCVLGTHPRLATLLDLSGPHVAILLAARRIAARDDTRASAEDAVDSTRNKGPLNATALALVPLTYQRIQDEYMSSFVASARYTTGSDRYATHVLYRACTDLMELDLVRLKKEHCRGSALQYGHNDALSAGIDVTNFPLHVNLEWDLEFMGALKAGLLQCSTALREWGMKMN